jgi:two-component system, NarL family, uhpT operon response regulator UhpA
VAEGIAALLERTGHYAVIPLTGWQQLLEHPDAPFDVAVVEQHLGDGVLIGTKVRELAAQGTRTVVIGRAAGTAARAALRSGATYLPKSDDAAALAGAVEAALDGDAPHPDHHGEHERDVPNLGRQEERALVHYASGMSVREVADAMATTEETVKSYIKRGRRKFRDAGIDIGTRALLRSYAVDSGWRAID